MVRKPSAFDKRLKAANKAYEAAHFSLHYDYKRKYAETLRKHGLANEGGLKAHLTLPLAFHEDMKEAQKNLVAGLALAVEARRVSVGRAPKAKVVKTFAGATRH
jgi:hypothetical protein